MLAPYSARVNQANSESSADTSYTRLSNLASMKLALYL